MLIPSISDKSPNVKKQYSNDSDVMIMVFHDADHWIQLTDDDDVEEDVIK